MYKEGGGYQVFAGTLRLMVPISKQMHADSLTHVLVHGLVVAAGCPVGGASAVDRPGQPRAELARPQEREEGVHIDGIHRVSRAGNTGPRGRDPPPRTTSVQYEKVTVPRERETKNKNPFFFSFFLRFLFISGV